MRKRGIVAGGVGAVIVTAAALRGVVRRFEVKESSMAPAIESGDWIVARRRTGPVERGDIVVFPDPRSGGRQLVKRVIGLGGETIAIDAGRVVINGALLADRWAHGAAPPGGPWRVPDDHVFVLGDNRVASSSDGRTIGPVAVDDIPWRAVARYWPTSRVGTLR
ncbi:MAG: signal peptidase I [Acidimicrobiia bacterium]